MSYIDFWGIKKDITDVLRDYLYPRNTVGNTFYTGMSIDTKYAQSFYPFTTRMNSISVYCNTVGSTLDDLTVSVQTDTNDAPSGTKVKSVTFSPSDITNDTWDSKSCLYSKLISKNKYWLVFESSNQDSTNYYKIGRDTVMTNYQMGIPKESTNSTWTTVSFDLMFNIDINDWIYPTYPDDTITLDKLPRIAVDIVDRRTEERYCHDSLALGNIVGMILVYSQYPDEVDKILSYGERGLFLKRTQLPNVTLFTPLGLSPLDRIMRKIYVRSSNFNLRKKLIGMKELPTVE